MKATSLIYRKLSQADFNLGKEVLKVVVDKGTSIFLQTQCLLNKCYRF